MAERCETCRFSKLLWRKGDPYTAFNEYDSREVKRFSTAFSCRRYAPRGPVIWPENGKDFETFPTVGEDDWCGEYQSSLPPPPSEEGGS